MSCVRANPVPRYDKVVTLLASDRQLLDAFRRGDDAALATVYFHYVDDIAGIIRNGFSIASGKTRVRGVDDEATERDLVQEVFARAFAPRSRACAEASPRERAPSGTPTRGRSPVE